MDFKKNIKGKDKILIFIKKRVALQQ